MAEVKYKTGAEVIAAALELNNTRIQSNFKTANDMTKDYYKAVPDFAADNAEELRRAYRAANVDKFTQTAQEFNRIIKPEFELIRQSAIALSPSDPEYDRARAMVNTMVNLVQLNLDAITTVSEANEDIKKKIADAKAAKEAAAKATPLSPAATAEPVPAKATETAASQVESSTPQASAPTAAAPVAENQLSATQRNNVIKAQSGQGGAANPEDAGTAVAKSKSEVSSADTVKLSKQSVTAEILRPNKLLEYPSYTYALSLHLLDRKTFNNMVDTGEYSATNVLIASAGRYNNATGPNAFNRNSRFKEDFYFEDMDIHTVIGLGETNRATNVVEGKFTVIEPYGFTLIDRIMNASKDIGILNYTQNPYMLQIDFYATKDDGTVVSPIPELTKNIPIAIRTCEVEVTSRGSEYQITCTAFNHQAFDHLVTQAPINAEVVAKNVEGFFRASAEATQALAGRMISDSEEREEYNKNLQEAKERAAMNNMVIPYTAMHSPRYSKDPWYTTQSYGDILNAHQLAIRARHKLRYVDHYQFKFDEEIGKAQLIKDEKISPSDRPMLDLKEAYIQAAKGLDNTTSAFGSGEVRTTINHGSSIEAIISRVIRNSSYITGQFNNIANQVDQKKYTSGQDAIEDIGLKWYKIIPSIKLLGFDPYTNTYAREITYNIVPFVIYNVRIDEAPKRKVTQNDCVKYYQYIYSGHNNDILDLKLNFNATYYTSITAYKESMKALSGTGEYYDTGTSCDVNIPLQRGLTVQPPMRRFKLPDQRDQASSRAKSAEELTAGDLERSIHVDARADMLNCTLKIIGDPEFIKQDDLFIKPKVNDQGYIIREWDNTRTRNGSIKTDKGEVYVLLTFRTPTDIDDATGMMKFSDERFSAFSGVYKVIEVRNYFSKGQFTQDLTMVRMPNQDPEDTVSKERTSDNAQQLVLGGQSPLEPESVVPDILKSPQQTPEPQDETSVSQPEPEPVPEPMPVPEQEDLANIRDSAPEVPIDSNNEPQLVPPITSNLSFAEAFKRARAANGGKPGGVFTWNGKQYQTNIVGEAYIDNPTPVTYNQSK